LDNSYAALPLAASSFVSGSTAALKVPGQMNLITTLKSSLR
jgi:hypothetical protein